MYYGICKLLSSKNLKGARTMSENELLDDILAIIKILNKGIRMENEASRFYAKAAESSPTKEGKRVFEWLAEFEQGHEEKIRAKREELVSHPLMKGVTPPELDPDYHVSEASGSDELPPEPSDTEILKLAIINEKKAYAFFQRKLTHAADDSLKKMWEAFAEEENKHITILSEMRQRLITDRIWGDIEEFEKDLKP